MRIRAARHDDLPAIRALLDVAGLAEGDIGAHVATLLVAEQQGMVVGAGAIEPLGTACLLRSIVVAPAWRGRGWGERMTRRLLGFAHSIGIGEAYLLTTGAGAFFTRQGFVEVRREDAPALVRRTRQFSELCPSTAMLMHARTAACRESMTTEERP
jgi:amino-acid N-acetyltransferase